MSISLILPLSISQELSMPIKPYSITEKRAERLLSKDKKEALYMGLWDKFKEYFRSEKKAEVLERLYDFIHNMDDLVEKKGSEHYTSFAKTVFSFLSLRTLANEAYKSNFVIDYNPAQGLDFYIGSEKIKTINNCRHYYPHCEALFVKYHYVNRLR